MKDRLKEILKDMERQLKRVEYGVHPTYKTREQVVDCYVEELTVFLKERR